MNMYEWYCRSCAEWSSEARSSEHTHWPIRPHYVKPSPGYHEYVWVVLLKRVYAYVVETISTLMSASTGVVISPHPYSYHAGVGGSLLSLQCFVQHVYQWVGICAQYLMTYFIRRCPSNVKITEPYAKVFLGKIDAKIISLKLCKFYIKSWPLCYRSTKPIPELTFYVWGKHYLIIRDIINV